MTAKSFRVLLVVVVGLVLVTWGLEIARNGDGGGGRQLLPGLADDANAASDVTIVMPGERPPVVLQRIDDRWAVTSRNDYPADVAKLRQLVLALSEATIVEEKTADPARYARLGVADPDAEGGGTRIVIAGEGFTHEVILGDAAQGDYRYARVPGNATSFLIDRDPDVPASAGDWLSAGIIDIGADRIRRVSVSHADGETIVIDKGARELTDFTVLDVPEGRELSYATVANGIAGALAKLTLEDVRARTNAEAATSTEFLTWDGTRIVATVTEDDDGRWFAFDVEAAAPGTGDESAAEDKDAAQGDEDALDVESLADRLTGWEYRLTDYKAGLLTRRWEELLKDTGSDAAG